MLHRKLDRARGADDQLQRLEASVSAMEAQLLEAARRGRELLMLQKEKQVQGLPLLPLLCWQQLMKQSACDEKQQRQKIQQSSVASALNQEK